MTLTILLKHFYNKQAKNFYYRVETYPYYLDLFLFDTMFKLHQDKKIKDYKVITGQGEHFGISCAWIDLDNSLNLLSFNCAGVQKLD